MSADIAAPPSPDAVARAAIEDILGAYGSGDRAILVNSPPGAGKTWLVEHLAGVGALLRGLRVMVSANTNQQAFDLTRRILRRFPTITLRLLVSKDLTVPQDLLPVRETDPASLTQRPCVVIANTRKWAWTDAMPFDVLLADEAYQMADRDFVGVMRLADGFVMVGDPGQIDPFTDAPIERWRCEKAGPHIAAPRAVLARRGVDSIRQFSLPVSRRLMPDSVAIIQPSFYPDLPFTAHAAPGDRWLRLPRRRAPSDALDTAIGLNCRGAGSLALITLPRLHTGEADPVLAGAIVAMAERLIERNAQLFDHEGQRAICPEDIAIVCAQTSQVNAVRERLPATFGPTLVDTANRLQGLERPVVLVYHPLSGRTDASVFHLDQGRLCVMTSRHSIACFVFGRDGMEQTLEDYVPQGDRVLGSSDDAEFDGLQAHMRFLSTLRAQGRMASLSV